MIGDHHGQAAGTATLLLTATDGIHGTRLGAAKRPWLAARLVEQQLALLRRLKTVFDPAGILNPGKLGS